MLEHERGGVDGGQRVGDALARNVVGGTVHGLEEGGAGTRRVEVGRGREADAAGDGAGEVGEDVAEVVVGDDDVVALRLLHQVDAGGIDMVVVPRHVGVVGGHLGDGPVPQVPGEGQDVRLVHEREVVAAPAGQLEGEAHAALR